VALKLFRYSILDVEVEATVEDAEGAEGAEGAGWQES
jgi:hypothetical protein